MTAPTTACLELALYAASSGSRDVQVVIVACITYKHASCLTVALSGCQGLRCGTLAKIIDEAMNDWQITC